MPEEQYMLYRRAYILTTETRTSDFHQLVPSTPWYANSTDVSSASVQIFERYTRTTDRRSSSEAADEVAEERSRSTE